MNSYIHTPYIVHLIQFTSPLPFYLLPSLFPFFPFPEYPISDLNPFSTDAFSIYPFLLMLSAIINLIPFFSLLLLAAAATTKMPITPPLLAAAMIESINLICPMQ